MSKKLLAALLCILVVVQSLPISVFADLNLENCKNEEELRLAIAGDEKWEENFPNGLFNFIGTNFRINEAQEFFEIPIVRQGGTHGDVSVDFKAIDISAEYGKDYVIRVYENSSKNEIAKNPESVPLVQSIGDNAEITISESVYEDNDTVTEAVYTPTKSYTDLSRKTLKLGGAESYRVNSLKEAKEAYLGRKSDRPDWRTIDSNKVEELKAEYDRFLYSVEGTETTLCFKDGEYIKYLYLVPLNDKLSESGEQVLFALERPSGGASRGEFYMGYADIADDEKPETPRFEIATPEVTAEDGKATVVVRRTRGLQQYATITIGTEEDTARSGIDYEPGLKELFFTPGTTEQKVTVNILDDPYREEERKFTIALDRTSDYVNMKAAEAEIIIPSASSNSILRIRKSPGDSAYKLSGSMLESLNAEKLSEFGYSPSKGRWMITGQDFIGNAVMEPSNSYYLWEAGEGFETDYTSKMDWSNGKYDNFSLKYPIGSMGGISNISFDYYNNGEGKIGGSGGWVYDFFVKFRLEGPYIGYYPDGNVYGETRTFNEHGEPVTYSRNLDSEDVTKADKISIVSYANAGNNTAPYFSGIQLDLKEYNLKVDSPADMSRTKYRLENGTLIKDSTITFNPGSFFVKQVNSNVGNYQVSPASPKAYRSDRIEFGYTYSNDNPNGNYASYTGYEVKGLYKDWWGYTSEKWIYHEGTELVLDADFFKTNCIWEGIKDGSIEIRPVYKKNDAAFKVNVNDNMVLSNIGTSNYFISDGNPRLYRGDVITGLTISSFADNTSKLPAWTSYPDWTDIPGKPGVVGVSITDQLRQTKADYTLEGSDNILVINLRTSLIIKANPNEYKNGVEMLPYKLDGVVYTDRDKFTQKIEEIYSSWDDDKIADLDPNIEMEFKYVYDTSFSDSTAAEKFGTPQTAYLKVYKMDGTLRSSYTIGAVNGIFKLSGRLKELQWESDDFASVVIEGSGTSDGVHIKTREIVVDFLFDSEDSISVLPPEGEGSTETWEGSIRKPVKIETANPLGYFGIKAATSPGFSVRWADFSPDADNSGEIEYGETDLLEKRLRDRMKNTGLDIDDYLDTTPYYGTNFFYSPRNFNPSRIYYHYEKSQDYTAERTVSIALTEKHSTVLRPDVYTLEKPLRNAEVYIGAKRIYDNNDGIYTDKSYKYEALAYYLGQVFYKGQIFNIAAQTGRINSAVINPSSLVRPDSSTFKAQYLINGIKKDPNNPLSASNPLLNISENDTVFSYKMEENDGVRVNDTIIRIYDSEDKLYLETRTGAPDTDGLFTKTINTFAEKISEGSYMTISGLLVEKYTVIEDGKEVQKEKIVHEYPEVDAGLLFKQPLTSLSLLASFKIPYKSAVDIIGKVNNQFDLGLNVNLENGIKSSAYTDKDGVTRYLRVLNIGFNSTYEKKFTDKTKNVEKTEDGQSNLDSNGNVKGNDAALKEEVGDKSEGDLEKAAEGAAAGAEKKPGTKNTGGGVLKMPYKISLMLVLELGQVKLDDSSYKVQAYDCLSSLVIMATANADYRSERTYMTPIGLPVTVTLSAGGGASVAVAFDAKSNDRYNARYRLDSKGTASISPTDYDIYSKFILTPYIELDAGTGYGYMKLNLTGRADFSINFDIPIVGDSSSSGTGKIKSISATLKVKMLFAQKKWTLYKSKSIDLFGPKGVSSDLMALALEDPYGSLMYEKVDAIDDDEIMPRDYLSYKSAWSGESEEDGGLLSGDAAAGSAIENILCTGVFPHPQTKLIPIDDDRMLLLFIEDDTDRDTRNRASLMYSIIEDGTASVPLPVDNDGTWDEDPDAFVVDDRIFITWSDSDRAFTSTDTEHDVLGNMDISAMWLDLQSGKLGDEISVTRTVYGGDDSSDINPKISYDPGTKRLMVFYTKTDHGIHFDTDPVTFPGGTVPYDETPDALYGDIINGYSTIAYRYAEFDNTEGEFIWNETYEYGETLDSTQYYGQRFPVLAPAAEITETEQDIEESVDIGGGSIPFFHKGTTQTVDFYTGYVDSRVEEMDITTYDGLGVMAYIVDYDSDLNTTEDHMLYIQTYDYSTGEFSYPIEVVNDTTQVQDTKPHFISAEGYTYLYWLRNGDLVYVCLDDILGKPGALKEVDVPGASAGEKFYIIDKSDMAKDAYIAKAIDHEGIIDDYNIVTNGGSIYAIWSEKQTSFRDGLLQGEPGTEKPENINKENQLYAACDIPGFPWSDAIQLTKEPGANYSDLSFAVLEDERLLASYVKYAQEFDEASGHFTDDNSVRSLALNTFTIGSELELGEISTDTEYPMPGSTVGIEAVLSNNGLKASENVYYQYYLLVNGTQYSESSWYPEKDSTESHYILGGAKETIYGEPVIPEILDGVDSLTVGFRLKNGEGDIIASREKELEIGPRLSIDSLDSYLGGEDKATLNLYVANTGNMDYDDRFEVIANGKSLYNEEFMLQAGAGKSISVDAALAGVEFGELMEAEDGSRFESLELIYSFGEFKGKGELKRSISAQEYGELQKVEALKLSKDGYELINGGRTYLNYDSAAVIESELVKKAGAEEPEGLKVEWSSSDKTVVAVMNDGTLVPMGIGTATVTASAQPDIKKVIAYDNGSFDLVDAAYTIPEGAKKKVSLNVSVIEASSGSGKKHDSQSSAQAGENVWTTERVEGEKLTLFFDEGALSRALSGAVGTIILESAASSANIRQLELMLTESNLRAINDSRVNRVTIKSILGDISLDRAAISAIAAEIGASADKHATVMFEVRDGIVNVFVRIYGRDISDLKGGSILVSYAYIPEEQMDPNGILVYDISDRDMKKPVRASMYDKETGRLLFSTGSTGRFVSGYNRIRYSDDLGWAEDHITFLSARGIVMGAGNGAFLKDKSVTRAEFITMLSRLEENIEQMTAATKFKDVHVDSWYAASVAWAYRNRIVTGTGSEEFSPDRPISREEMAVILYRYMKYAKLELQETEDQEFSDGDLVSDWAAEAVNMMKAAGLIKGTGGSRFEPARISNRAEASKIIAELIRYLLR